MTSSLGLHTVHEGAEVLASPYTRYDPNLMLEFVFA